MRPFRVLVSIEILKLERPSRQDRDAILSFLESLEADPTKRGDYSERDDSGRTVWIKVIGKYALTFWADHAVCEVKVTRIEKAD